MATRKKNEIDGAKPRAVALSKRDPVLEVGDVAAAVGFVADKLAAAGKGDDLGKKVLHKVWQFHVLKRYPRALLGFRPHLPGATLL